MQIKEALVITLSFIILMIAIMTNAAIAAEPTEACGNGNNCAHYGCAAACGNNCRCAGCTDQNCHCNYGEDCSGECGCVNYAVHGSYINGNAMLLEFPAISTFQDERSNWTLINLVLSLIGIVIFAFHFMPKFDAEKSGTKKNSAELRYMGVLVALGIVMLSLTQDFGGIMTFFDWWTIIHIFIFASIILCSCFHHQRQEERCDLNN